MHRRRGRLKPQNSNEFQTIEYGFLRTNTLSQKIEDIDMLGLPEKGKTIGECYI